MNFIKSAIHHPGALRARLHIKPGHTIPTAKLVKAEHSKDPTERREAILAETLKHLHHGRSHKQ